VYRPQSVVYKVDYLILRTLWSSFVLLNIKVIILELDTLFWDYSTQSSFYSLLFYHSWLKTTPLLVKKTYHTLDIRCKEIGSSKTFFFHIFWLFYISWSILISIFIHLFNFSYSRLLQTVHQYSQLSRHIIKLPFMLFLALLQHSAVFWSLLVSSTHLLICFSVL